MLANLPRLRSLVVPEHGVDCGVRGALLVVVNELGDEFLCAAAAVVDQLQRGLALVEGEAPPHQDPEGR